MRIKLFEDFSKLYEGVSKYFLLNSGSQIKTTDPLKNEYVKAWSDDENTTYLLVELEGNGSKLIIAGSGKGYAKPEEMMNLFDDGNRTTRLASNRSGYNGGSGTRAKVLNTAYGSEEIKKFPEGSYKLYVMK